MLASAAALIAVLPTAAAVGLELQLYADTGLAGSSASRVVPTLSFALDRTAHQSAEVTGTLDPPLSVTTLRFECDFTGAAFAILRVDGHVVCQHGAYNNSANGQMDDSFRLLSKRSGLAMHLQFYSMAPGSSNLSSANVRGCFNGAPCAAIPADWLKPTLTPPEQRRRDMQSRLLHSGWGSWLHSDCLSVVLLPDAAVVGVQLCQLSTGQCLRGSPIDANGGSKEQPVRVGMHAMDHSSSSLFAWHESLNVSVQYAASGRELDLIVTAQQPSLGSDTNFSDFGLVFTADFAWGRRGRVEALSTGLALQGAALERVELSISGGSPLPAHRTPPIVPRGKAAGEQCSAKHAKECSSGRCTCALGGVCSCDAPDQLIHYAVALAPGAVVRLTTRNSSNAGASIDARVAEAHQRTARGHSALFGEGLAEVVEAVTAAVAWRNVYVPAEEGTVMPMTFGFSWITPQPITNEWGYVLFCWDNLFSSLIAGVLGHRTYAYSNLIATVKSKHADGFVPNWMAGGSKSPTSEPPVGSRVLLDLFRRFGDVWIVELLFHDLLDWHEWQWHRRRVINQGEAREPGFVTYGNDYGSNCTGSYCSYGVESGQDQSPLWDCPGAKPDGSGGNCSALAEPSSSPHLMQLGDLAATSLFVLDAEALAELASILNRADDRHTLLSRAEAMRRQLTKMWDPAQGSFADVYVQSGQFSAVKTPNIFYPLFAHAATEAQVESMVNRYLLNASHFCVSESFATTNPSTCYWGLPSVSASDKTYMQPPSFIYWRGLSWGPMTLLTWWGLDAYPAAHHARSTLAQQKTAMMMSLWRRRRHICENYSPYAPDESLPPGNGKSNTECTGWQFHSWGALHGLVSLLEAEKRRPGVVAWEAVRI